MHVNTLVLSAKARKSASRGMRSAPWSLTHGASHNVDNLLQEQSSRTQSMARTCDRTLSAVSRHCTTVLSLVRTPTAAGTRRDRCTASTRIRRDGSGLSRVHDHTLPSWRPPCHPAPSPAPRPHPHPHRHACMPAPLRVAMPLAQHRAASGHACMPPAVALKTTRPLSRRVSVYNTQPTM